MLGRSNGRMSEPVRHRVIVWSGVDVWRAEICSMHLDIDGLTAEGTQIGISPVPYRLEYRLDALSPEGWR